MNMKEKNEKPLKPLSGLESLLQGTSGDPLPLGVYPTFDDDLPRDPTWENFPSPDLWELHPYPWGLTESYEAAGPNASRHDP